MSFASYPKYKDSGDAWLGAVPSHWRPSTLKYLANYQNGFPFKPEDWSLEGRPIIRIAQLTGSAEPNRFEGELDDRVSVQPGDLLFSWSATLDSFFWEGEPAWLNQHIFKVSPTREAAKEYLYYLIKFWAPKLADVDADGSTMRHIKKESLGQKVFVPPVKEQASIAALLNRETAKIDALVAEQQKLIALLKEKRLAVISHAVTKGLDPTVPMKDSGVEWLGEVPAHWAVTRLAHGAAIENGTTPSRDNPAYWLDGDIPWLSSGEVNQYRIIEAKEFITPQALDQCSLRLLPRGTIVIGMIGQGKTRGIAASLEIEASINQNLAAIVPGKNLASDYLLYIFQSVYEYLREFGRGGNQAALNCEILSALKVPFPPFDEQSLVCEHLEARVKQFSTLTDEAQRAIDLLQERRTALISAAVTGKIDVRASVARELEPA